MVAFPHKQGGTGAECSAGFQPAVSRIYNPRRVKIAGARYSDTQAECNSAIQRITNPRYKPWHYFPSQGAIFSAVQISSTGWRSRTTAAFLPFTRTSAAIEREL